MEMEHALCAPVAGTVHVVDVVVDRQVALGQVLLVLDEQAA
jgi:biotin carboxyl carrier protein